MSYVITTVRRKGDSPRTMTVDQPSDREAKSFCAHLAVQYQRVTLHGMDADGILSVVGRWQGGHAKRGTVDSGPVPRAQRVRPVEVIDGEVESQNEGVRRPTFSDADLAEYLEPEGEPLDPESNPFVEQDETSNEDEDSGTTYEGYCVKCREKREFHGHVEESDSGRRMAKGTCPVCGTKMNRILANLPHAEQDDYHTPDDAEDETEVRADVVSAVVAAAEGQSADVIAQAVSQVAEDISEAVTEAAEAPTTRRPPRPRKGDKKAKEDKTADLPVAACFKCGQKIPVQDKAGIRIMMQHSAPGIERCAGSLTVVQ